MVIVSLMRKLDPERYKHLRDVKITWRPSHERRYPAIGIPKEVRKLIIGDGVEYLSLYYDTKTGFVILIPMVGEKGEKNEDSEDS